MNSADFSGHVRGFGSGGHHHNRVPVAGQDAERPQELIAAEPAGCRRGVGSDHRLTDTTHSAAEVPHVTHVPENC